MLPLLCAIQERGVKAVDELGNADSRRFVERLLSTWIAGDIPLTAVGASGRTDADRRIARLWRKLPQRLTAGLDVECDAPSDADIRRWCWIDGWHLMSQDEDLLLMDDALVPLLLEEVGEGCTKRDYVLAIVGHHARDSAHHALWDGAKRLAARLRRIARWAPLAKAVGADELATYLDRLGGYAKPRKVDEADIRQRVFDLRRCSPDEGRRPSPHREGRYWVARLDRANISEGYLVVDADTGRMQGRTKPF